MVRTLRITTGLILFAFVTTHLLNMAMGLVSLELVESSRRYFMAPWSNPLGFFLLIGSMGFHLAVGLLALYKRNTLRMPRYDAVQFVSALLIVPLLVPHLLGVTLAANMLNFKPSYTSVLTVFWVDNPAEGLRQVLLVAVTWIHGCIGLFTWMRLKAWWSRTGLVAYPLAVAIPVLALLGFVEAGNQVIATAAQAAQSSYASPAASAEESARLQELYALYLNIKWSIIGIYTLLVIAILAARAIRLRGVSRNLVELHYQSGPVFTSETGTTLLEMAQLHDLPHANICRGRGRCGTCRVQIKSSTSDLPAPSELEQKTLDRFGSPDGTRLACQIVPTAGIIELQRLLPPDLSVEDMRKRKSADASTEELADAPAAEVA